jgi:sugar lactone lactonase YvrE
LIFEPGGRVIWTAFFLGKVFAPGADGRIIILAENLPGANAIARSSDGRVFFSQVFMGDALWELDLSGKMKNRKIAEKLGGLNAFSVHSDGSIYGPRWFKGDVVKVNVKTGKLTVIADGFKVPAAAKFDSKGNLFVIDNKAGKITRIDIRTGEKQTITDKLRNPKGIAVKPDGTILVVNVGTQEPLQVDPQTGAISPLVEHLPVGLFVPKGFMPAFTLSGVAVSKADNIYLTSDIDNVIYKLSPEF